MFSDMIVSFIEFISFLVSNFLPHFSLDSSVVSHANSAISQLNEFLSNVNFIIPLSDILLIIGIDLGIRVFKLTLFVGNYIKKTILSIIP